MKVIEDTRTLLGQVLSDEETLPEKHDAFNGLVAAFQGGRGGLRRCDFRRSRANHGVHL